MIVVSTQFQQGLSAVLLLDQKVDDQTQGNNKNRHKGRSKSTCRSTHTHARAQPIVLLHYLSWLKLRN